MQTNTIYNHDFQKLIGKKYPKTFEKWLKRCQDIETPWTENQIIYFRKYLRTLSNKKDLESILWEAYDENPEREITPEQSLKGINYIRNVCFRKDGTIRKTKHQPFGYRESEIIKDFKKFTFVGLYNIGTYCPWYVPVYRVYSNTGRYFDYYAGSQGQMEVIG